MFIRNMSWRNACLCTVVICLGGASFIVSIVGCRPETASDVRENDSKTVAPETSASMPVDVGATTIQATSEELEWNLSRAWEEVNFSQEADENGAVGPNGIPDYFEIALIEAVLNQPELDLSDRHGVRATDVRLAWEQAWRSAAIDVAVHRSQWPHVPTVIAGYKMIGTAESSLAIERLTESFGTPLKGDYSRSTAMAQWFGPEGDADGDGASNLEEFRGTVEPRLTNYLLAALDPSKVPEGNAGTQSTTTENSGVGPQVVGVILYPGFEVLDVYGPVEIWANVNSWRVVTIAEEVGPVVSAQGLATIAEYNFANAPKLDIVMVPGGTGTLAQLENQKFLDFLRKVDATSRFTTSVCTGSALLAKAGLLNGRRATSNKAFFSLAERQSNQVEWVKSARWVEDGKYFTSSGVSAGTDMAVALVAEIWGEEYARTLAFQLEYRWHSQAAEDPFARTPPP